MGARYFFIIFLCLLICGCSMGKAGKRIDATEEGEKMSKELTFEEARGLALKLVNEAFAKERFELPGGRLVPTVKLDDILGTKRENRWEFCRPDAPAGPWADVSFDLDGGNPKVEVGYSPQ